jgi:hypothetical protein
MRPRRARVTIEVIRKEDAMVAAPELEPEEKLDASPASHRPHRHLRLVPHHHPFADAEARSVSEARWIAALIAITTAAVIGLWTAAMYGAADSAWWPALLGGAVLGVVAFAVLAVLATR